MSSSVFAVQAGGYWLVQKGDKYVWRRGRPGQQEAALFTDVKAAQAAAKQARGGTAGNAAEVVAAPTGSPDKKKRVDHYVIRRMYLDGSFEWVTEGHGGRLYWTASKRHAKAFPTREAAEAANKTLKNSVGEIVKVTRYRKV